MTIDPNEFVETARYILQTITAVYAEHGVDLPERRYLAVGGPGMTVHDTEQVTVSFEQGYSGIPGSQAQTPVKCDAPRTGVFVIEVVRCLPLPNTPVSNPKSPQPSRYSQEVTDVQLLPPEVQTAHAEKQMVDAMLLLDAGLRVGEFTTFGSVADVSAGQPQGGFQAMTLMLTSSATPLS